MIGSTTLLFPDTGDDFLRSVKMAALYSEHINVLTMLDQGFLDRIEDDAFRITSTYISPKNKPSLYPHLRVIQYAESVRSIRRDLLIIQKEGVLSSLIGRDRWQGSFSYFRKVATAMANDLPTTSELTGKIISALEDALKELPPSFMDL